MNVDVTKLTFAELNALCNDCQDEKLLERWLKAMTDAGWFNRAMRVYGRYSAVRRANELAVMKVRIQQIKQGDV